MGMADAGSSNDRQARGDRQSLECTSEDTADGASCDTECVINSLVVTAKVQVQAQPLNIIIGWSMGTSRLRVAPPHVP